MDTKLRDMEDEIAEVLREEQEEKQLAQAAMQLTRGENLVKHEKEIMARPKRTWFESEKEKRISKTAGRAELNGIDSIRPKKQKQKQKLSGKDKKRLDDRRERIEGKMWRKGKESEEAAKASRRRPQSRKGSKASTKTAKGRRRPKA